MCRQRAWTSTCRLAVARAPAMARASRASMRPSSSPWSRQPILLPAKPYRPQTHSGRPLAQARGRLSLPRMVKAGGSGDGGDFEFLGTQADDVTDGLVEQNAGNRRNMGNRAGARLGFVLADNAIGLHAAVGATEGDRAAKG